MQEVYDILTVEDSSKVFRGIKVSLLQATGLLLPPTVNFMLSLARLPAA